MSEILGIALPFFGLIFLGYGAGSAGRLASEALAGLDRFVLYFALPALFFQGLAETPIDAFANWSFIATTTFATYCAFAIAFSFGALVNRGNVPEATIEGLLGSASNLSLMGPALALATFGAAAGAPAALIFTFDTVMLAVLVPLMMALGRTDQADFETVLAQIVRQIVFHPLVIATVLGLLASAIGFKAPGPLAAFLDLLRGAAPPTALFLLGATLALKPLGSVPLELPVLVAVKLVAHPVIVYLLLTWVGGFDPVWVRTAVLLAALPPATGILQFARQYGAYAGTASTGVVMGTIVSIATLTIALILMLGDRFPAAFP
jgi:predicted permease